MMNFPLVWFGLSAVRPWNAELVRLLLQDRDIFKNIGAKLTHFGEFTIIWRKLHFFVAVTIAVPVK
jgi:hypothetical protein